MPELNLVPLDPLYIPRLEFREGGGNFRFNGVLNNVTILGLGAFQLLNTTWVLVCSIACSALFVLHCWDGSESARNSKDHLGDLAADGLVTLLSLSQRRSVRSKDDALVEVGLTN